jgi:multicomponent K+:H+ antiporter subunit G
VLIEAVTSLLVLIGGGFALIGSIGLARLPDFFARLHGPTKATTLGVGSIVIASLVDVSAEAAGISFRELAISLFLFITAPVSAHMLAKAALRSARREQGADRPDVRQSGRRAAEADGARDVQRDAGPDAQ